MNKVLPFSHETDFTPGFVQQVVPGLRRVLADNPGPLTFKGTNSYIVGTGEVALIDPGPEDEAHRKVILDELSRNGERISHIVLTHTHFDHCEGLRPIAEKTGASVLGYGSDTPSRREIKDNPASRRFLDLDFVPDETLRGGEVISHGDWKLEAIFTPGHAPDHLCFALGDGKTLISGDHVMGWNTSVVAPPEGDMGDYIRSLELLLKRPETIYFPGHGGRIDQATRLVKALIMHRRWREAQILDCLRDGLETIDSIVPRIYDGLASSLHGAAAYSVYAHLILLVQSGQVLAEQRNDIHSRFRISDAPA
jgi:glyoxylase-like metal-dependent hydrolase (beta-lactamase superfamily II)